MHEQLNATLETDEAHAAVSDQDSHPLLKPKVRSLTLG